MSNPYKEHESWNFDGDNYERLGEYNLTCDWCDTLIDVNKIKVK